MLHSRISFHVQNVFFFLLLLLLRKNIASFVFFSPKVCHITVAYLSSRVVYGSMDVVNKRLNEVMDTS
jgi:hypothetical protein